MKREYIYFFVVFLKGDNTLSRKTKQASQLYDHLTGRQLQSHSSTGSTAKPEFSYKPDDTLGKIYSRACYPAPAPAKFAHMGPQGLAQPKEEIDGKREKSINISSSEYHQVSAEVATSPFPMKRVLLETCMGRYLKAQHIKCKSSLRCSIFTHVWTQ